MADNIKYVLFKTWEITSHQVILEKTFLKKYESAQMFQPTK